MSWRVEGDDPYGAEAFCGAIGYVKFGRNYNRSTLLRLLPTQLAWFAYVVCYLCGCIFGFLIAVVKLCVIHLLIERCAQLDLVI